MAKKKAIRREVWGGFVILAFLICMMPTSVFGSTNSDITTEGLSTAQAQSKSNLNLRGGIHVLSTGLFLTKTDYDMSIAVEDIRGIGRYTEATAEGKKLLYGYPDAGTSYTTIRITPAYTSHRQDIPSYTCE